MYTLKLLQKYNISTVLKTCRSTFSRRCYSQPSFEVKTNVAKDVILYKYENDKFYKVINLFALSQFGFWTYLSFFAMNNLKSIPVSTDENAPWWRKINLGDNKIRLPIVIGSFILGWGILFITWTYSLKSIKYLILLKGGTRLTMVTYSPIGKNRIMTLPLNCVSCKEGRTVAQSQLPLKVKGHYLHYIMDMRGEFKNTTLFDNTAGLRRKFREAT